MLVEVAAVDAAPFVVLLDQHKPGQAQQSGRVREGSRDVGAPFDLFVDPFERVSRPDLPPARDGEPGEREFVVAGRFEHAHDLVELSAHVLGVGLSENRADDRGDHGAGGHPHVCQHVAHEVDSASLPAGALEDGLDRGDQAGVSVREDQLHPVQTADLQRARAGGPERLRFGVSHPEAEHPPAPGGGGAARNDDGL